MNSVGYEIPCITCKKQCIKKVYSGESSRNGKVRVSEHLRGLKNKMVNNPLYRHKMVDHSEEQVEFQMNILQKFKEPVTRSVLLL